MEQTALTLTVYFEEPFWVGVFERTEGDNLSVCKCTFGAEPKDAEILALVQKHFRRLTFGPIVAADIPRPVHVNPKRRQREVAKTLAAHGTSTKAQQALALEREALKTARQKAHRQAKQLDAAARYAKKCAKRKNKHRGH
ncbi:MAG: YjdF family protein [Peptococcaceae bacterium]|nr:YjdF family protein [Peptococcaceae bacterium]